MDQVFAPWRIEWVEREDHNQDVEGCVFCALPDRDEDRERRLVARSERSFVVCNNYPYNPGHVMVIPRKHEASFGPLSDAALLDHARLRSRTIEALETAFDPDGCNVGLNLGGDAAGGSIDDHVHTHVVPRWRGDTNFMAVIGETKVIVEALEDTYERLHDAFATQDGTTVDGADRAVRITEDRQ